MIGRWLVSQFPLFSGKWKNPPSFGMTKSQHFMVSVMIGKRQMQNQCQLVSTLVIFLKKYELVSV
jgi:hypothetical protein